MWRVITEDDLIGVLNESETAAYQLAVNSSGRDIFSLVTTPVVNQCRGYIADNSVNQLAEGLTLPERVHLSALHLVRVEMLTRLDMEVSKDRESAKRDAIRFFERVSDGRVAIEQPTGTIETSGAVQTIKVLSNNERQATRDKLSGL